MFQCCAVCTSRPPSQTSIMPFITERVSLPPKSGARNGFDMNLNAVSSKPASSFRCGARRHSTLSLVRIRHFHLQISREFSHERIRWKRQQRNIFFDVEKDDETVSSVSEGKNCKQNNFHSGGDK